MNSDESPNQVKKLDPTITGSDKLEQQNTADERMTDPAVESNNLETQSHTANAQESATQLEQRVAALKQEIAALEATKNTLNAQISESQATLANMFKAGTTELEQRRQTLQIAVEQLERRQERIRNEMKTTFAGVSQELAIRVQGFKDYLVGSLQDLAVAVEQLDLVPQTSQTETVVVKEAAATTNKETPTPAFAQQGFQEQSRQIRQLIDTYRTRPDYYGPPWQLRRTFEPIHAERASYWFFTQGGKGAVRSLGSRLQNILVASSIISVLRAIYDEDLRPLILVNSPERLGEWRRGLQDCLGITRADFSPERGIVLFEAPEPLALKADRLIKDGEMPLVIVDETEDQISLSVLQFPLWLAFARDPQAPSYYNDRY